MKCQGIDSQGKRALFQLERTSETSLQMVMPDGKVYYLFVEQVALVLLNYVPPAVRYCTCDDMANAIAREDIIQHSDGLYIRGVPNLVDDGDDIMDDMTGEYHIKICPWCGKAISPAMPEKYQ